MKTFLSAIALLVALTLNAQDYTVYVGTYTAPNASKGIYKFGFNSKTGDATAIDLAAETESPSFVAIHKNGRFLYAVNETGTFAGKKTGRRQRLFNRPIDAQINRPEPTTFPRR